MVQHQVPQEREVPDLRGGGRLSPAAPHGSGGRTFSPGPRSHGRQAAPHSLAIPRGTWAVARQFILLLVEFCFIDFFPV